MGLRRQAYCISYFTCPSCGKVFPLPRKRGSRRSRGHIKDIYCPFCKETKKYIEKY